MYRKLRGGFASEDGMSIFEVVLAAFVLFFVLTAVLGLVSTTTRMGLSARQRTSMTNAVSSHIERIRALDFDDIALYPDGDVQPETVIEVDGFTVTILVTITHGAGDTRELAITATSDADGFEPMTMTTYAAIRDWSSGIVMALEPGDGPEVAFTNSTPDAETVVYASYTQSNAPLYIAVTAEASEEDQAITSLGMYCANDLLRDGATTFANFATWNPNEHTVSKSFRWNTLQVRDEDGQPSVPDGLRLVRVLAEDSAGGRGIAERYFTVDNYAPHQNPGAPSGLVHTDVLVRVGWDKARDGTDDASKYVLRLWRIEESGSLGAMTEILDLQSNAYAHATTSFSRYTASVSASSPRNLMTDFVPADAPYVSRATASGTSVTTYTGDKNQRQSDTDVSLSVTAPTFPVSAIRYDVYRSLTPDTLMASTPHATNTGPSFQDSINKRVGRTGSPDPYYYAFRITFTPSGYAGGQEESVWSDIIGPTTELETTQPMEHYSW